MGARIICYSLRLFLLVLVVSTFLFSQNQPPSDPQAVNIATQATAAMTGGTAISDATLSGNVTRIAGSDTENGTATFYAKGQWESRVDLALNGGSRKEVRNSAPGYSQGQWVDPDGTAHAFSPNNCSTDAVWFFPALSSLAAVNNPNLGLSYIGLESLNGTSVQHLRSEWAGDDLSSMDFYLDANSLLPVQISFNAHADNNANINIPVQILFSSYQPVNGALVPFHVQEWLNGSLLLDFVVSGATINSGLSDSLFVLQ